MYAPYEYSKLNMLVGSYSPNSIHTGDNEAFYFWQRALFQRIQSTYKIKKIPLSWKGMIEDFLDYVLITFGYAAVGKDDQHGPFFTAASLSGFNMYYQPTEAIANNPEFSGRRMIIGKDCELLKLTPDYRGLMDIVDYYAEKLALIDTSTNISLINSKIPFYMFADTKAAAESIKKMMDEVNKGNPAVVANSAINVKRPDGNEIIEVLKLFSASDYITDKLLADHSTLINNFDAEIGIPSVPFEKKERLVTAEADSRKLDSTARARTWLDTLTASCEIINDRFGLELEPVLTVDEYNKEDAVNEDNTDRNGTVPEQ